MSSIEGFSKSLKSIQRDRAVLAWSVRWVLSIRVPKQAKSETKPTVKVTMTNQLESYGKTFVLYRIQMLKLLSFPKPMFDQLALELPCLMGFRASEVASWMAEYIDYQNMNTLVMDIKKKKLFTIPLNIYVANHAEEVLDGRSKGYVLRSRSNRNRNQKLTPTTIWYIWDKWTKQAGLPNAKDISPLTGRQFFAAYWYHWLQQSLMTLSLIMRHSDPRVTLGYVQHLVFYEDVKRDYDSFQRSFAQDQDRFNFNMMSKPLEKEAK